MTTTRLSGIAVEAEKVIIPSRTKIDVKEVVYLENEGTTTLPDYSDYDERLTQLLFRLLPPDATKYVEKNLELYKSAFTHESYCVQFPEAIDYEEAELQGDKILGVVFLDYSRKQFPEFKKDQLSQLITNYMSKGPGGQADIAANYNLGDFIRVGHDITGVYVPITNEIRGDVFESLFGALYKSAPNTGVGHYFCGQLLEKLFESIKIDVNRSYQAPSTLFGQKLEVLEDRMDSRDGVITISIYLPASHIPLLRSISKLDEKYGKLANKLQTDSKDAEIGGKVRQCILIGIGRAYEKKFARFTAYNSAINTLTTSFGIGIKEINEINRLVDINKYYDLWTAVDAKIAPNKLDRFKFIDKSNTPDGQYLYLYGFDKNGKSIKVAFSRRAQMGDPKYAILQHLLK